MLHVYTGHSPWSITNIKKKGILLNYSNYLENLHTLFFKVHCYSSLKVLLIIMQSTMLD